MIKRGKSTPTVVPLFENLHELRIENWRLPICRRYTRNSSTVLQVQAEIENVLISKTMCLRFIFVKTRLQQASNLLNKLHLGNLALLVFFLVLDLLENKSSDNNVDHIANKKEQAAP